MPWRGTLLEGLDDDHSAAAMWAWRYRWFIGIVVVGLRIAGLAL